MTRVVLDANMLVSALLIEKGRLAWSRLGWQGGRFTPVLAQPTTLELIWVDGYPKFGHTPAEIERLLGELLPWSETWNDALVLMQPLCRDPFAQAFPPLLPQGEQQGTAAGDQLPFLGQHQHSGGPRNPSP
jgi:hypothetical protein